MKPTFSSLGNYRALIVPALAISLFACNVTLSRAQDAPASTGTNTTANADADAAWRLVRKAAQSPMPPTEWQTTPPTQEQAAKFYLPLLLKGADEAKDFYTKYPTHPKAADAHHIEYELLTIATTRFGDTTQTARLDALTAARANDPSLSPDEKLEMRMSALKPLFAKLPDSRPELLKKARALQKDFPDRPEAYQVMTSLMMESEGDDAKSLAQEIVNSSAPDEVKEQAKGVLKRMDSVGKPVDIQYTAVDGRAVDISKLKGKVVLVDFWATWCGPCMGELPNVKAAYAKLHPQGFEIVGISFDQDKGALEKTLKEKEMTWPQYFDGDGWKNKFGQQFGINSIPTMWLVDKKGNLRDLNARGELEEKVTKLLAEQ
jgi:thiol-disulfide isomerase/thioredoxin